MPTEKQAFTRSGIVDSCELSHVSREMEAVNLEPRITPGQNSLKVQTRSLKDYLLGVQSRITPLRDTQAEVIEFSCADARSKISDIRQKRQNRD